MIRLCVLGTLDLRAADDESIDAVLAQPKRLALLAYLAVASPRGFQRRDVLVALLWPELEQARARNALSQALHHLRRALGTEAIEARGDEEVRVAGAVVWCDARAFDESLSLGRTEEALALYRGELLAGFFLSGGGGGGGAGGSAGGAPGFERWLEEERGGYRGRAARSAWTLAVDCARKGDSVGAAQWARWAANQLPDDEASLRRLIALLDRLGDRAGALRAYDDFSRRLDAEYRALPSAETELLIRSVRARVAAFEVADGGGSAAESGTAATEPSGRPSGPVVATISQPADAERGRDPSPSLEPRPRPPRSRVRRALALGSALLVVVMLLIAYRARASRSEPSVATASIAVLPFLDLTPGGADEYLSDGMAEELSDALSRVDNLRVTSRTSAFAFKGKPADARSIGRALGVDALLEGSVRREGHTLRVTAQLIDARTGYHRWSRTYDRELADVFAVQDDIAQAIVGELTQRLTGPSRSSFVQRPTPSVEAYTWYLQGRYFWNQRTGPALTKAVSCFEHAIALDSRYARALAGVADAYNVLAGQTYIDPEIAFPKAKSAALRALDLDSTLVEAHAALGFIHIFGEWNGPAANRELQRALSLDPNYSSARLYDAFYLLAVGQPERAVDEIRRAQRLDPLSLIINARVGFVLVMAHRFDEAVTAERHALELDSTFAPAYWSLGSALMWQRRYPLALAQFAKARAYSGLMLGDFGYALAKSGDVGAARRYLAQLDARDRTGFVDAYDRALVHVGLGERDEALRLLGVAHDRHSASLLFLRSEPMLDDLRADPRFVSLVQRVGL